MGLRTLFRIERLLSHSLRSSAQVARAMTYVDLYSLSRVSLMKAIANFPKAQRLVRRSAILVSLRREVIRLAKMQRFAENSTSFVDNVLKASEEHTASESMQHAAAGLKKGQHARGLGVKLNGAGESIQDAIADLRGEMQKTMKEMMVGLMGMNQGGGSGGGGGGGGAGSGAGAAGGGGTASGGAMDAALGRELLSALAAMRQDMAEQKQELAAQRAEMKEEVGSLKVVVADLRSQLKSSGVGLPG